MTDYDVPYQCACCGKMTTNYLCGRCAKEHYSNDIDALRAALLRAERMEKVVEAAKMVMHETRSLFGGPGVLQLTEAEQTLDAAIESMDNGASR